MNYKEFHGSRVCAIDFEPLLIQAIRETLFVCKKYNIPLKVNGKGSTDVTRFFYHYCLEKFCAALKECPSKYNKALVVYPITKGIPFTNIKLKKVLNVFPSPWCECTSFNSPDIEMSVLSAINKNKINNQNIDKFANKNMLYTFIKNYKKNKTFSSGTVDFSDNL